MTLASMVSVEWNPAERRWKREVTNKSMKCIVRRLHCVCTSWRALAQTSVTEATAVIARAVLSYDRQRSRVASTGIPTSMLHDAVCYMLQQLRH